MLGGWRASTACCCVGLSTAFFSPSLIKCLRPRSTTGHGSHKSCHNERVACVDLDVSPAEVREPWDFFCRLRAGRMKHEQSEGNLDTMSLQTSIHWLFVFIPITGRMEHAGE